MDEGRKRVVAIVAGILVARHLKTADDLFEGPERSPRTDAMVAAAVQWAERILTKIDNVHGKWLVITHQLKVMNAEIGTDAQVAVRLNNPQMRN